MTLLKSDILFNYCSFIRTKSPFRNQTCLFSQQNGSLCFLLQLSLYPDKSSFSFFFHFFTSILLFYRIMTVITPSKAELFRFWQVCCLQLPNIQAKLQKRSCRFTGSLCIFKFYFAALARSMNDVNLPMHSEGAWLIVSLRTPAFSTDLTSELPILPSKLRSPAYFV